MSVSTLERKAYRRYMKTNRWQDLRDAALARDGYECVRCGSGANLQVHHLTYSRLYNEDLGDLVTWCKPCHRHHHELMQKKHNRRSGTTPGICRGCGDEMVKPYWGPGGGYYCGYGCKGRKPRATSH